MLTAVKHAGDDALDRLDPMLTALRSIPHDFERFDRHDGRAAETALRDIRAALTGHHS